MKSSSLHIAGNTVFKKLSFFTLVVFVLCLISACNRIQRLYIQYGDAKQTIEKWGDDQVLRIYFDRQGFIYPDYHISDAALKSSDSRLGQFYENNEEVYRSICQQYQIPGQNPEDINSMIDPLQKELVRRYVQQINEANTVGTTLVFLVEGFNKHPVKGGEQVEEGKSYGKNSGYGEYKAMRETISSRFPDRKFLFVEVYWDGMSKQNGRPLRLWNTVKIWDNAQVSACYAGLELRRILAGIEASKFYMFSHSQGAGVITTALFNVRKFKPDFFEGEGKFIPERDQKLQYRTPTQDIHIGMLCPAIPGVNVFDEYWDRTFVNETRKDSLTNYHFIIGFNKSDIATRKLYISSKIKGSTSLASNRKELKKTMNLFKNDRSIVDWVDFTRLKNFRHNVKFYLKYHKSMDTFLSKTFK